MLSSVPADTFPQALAECRKTARLGLLLALSAALYIVEAQFPALPLPGARLGLANLVSVLVLYGWGLRETLLLGILRQVLGGALTGTLFGMPFYFGMAGTILSALAMFVAWEAAGRRSHPIVVSLVGAIAHNLAQLGVAYAFVRQPVVLAYLPYLLYFALPAGAVVGYMASMLLPTLYTEIDTLNTQAGVATLAGTRRVVLAWAITVVLGVGALIVGQQIWRVQSQVAVAADTYARVMVNGAETARLPLNQDTVYDVPLANGYMDIVVRNGEVWVVKSSCPDQICVRTGRIHKPGQGIVCVPNRVSIDILAPTQSANQSIDAVTW